MRADDPWFEDAQRFLKVIANVNRLRLIEMLQRPRAYAEMALPPSRGSEEADNPPRYISRQALHQHVTALQRAGILARVPDAVEPRHVVNRAALWTGYDALRRLVQGRAEVELPAEVEPRPPPYRVDHAGAHLVLIRGADEGRVFPLDAEGPWSLGRTRAADIRLDYDAGVSPLHARISASGGRHEITDLGAVNGTFVNWRRLRKDAPRALQHGDVVGAGSSFLLYRAG